MCPEGPCFSSKLYNWVPQLCVTVLIFFAVFSHRKSLASSQALGESANLSRALKMSGITLTFVEGLLMDNLGGSPLENSVVYVVLAMLHESSGQHELAKMHAMKAVDCHDLHTGTRLENSKNEADKAQYAKPFPPDQAPPAIGRFDPETAFEKIGNNYRPSVVTFDKFNGIQQLIRIKLSTSAVLWKVCAWCSPAPPLYMRIIGHVFSFQSTPFLRQKHDILMLLCTMLVTMSIRMRFA
jgi:hypothetical protein